MNTYPSQTATQK